MEQIYFTTTKSYTSAITLLIASISAVASEEPIRGSLAEFQVDGMRQVMTHPFHVRVVGNEFLLAQDGGALLRGMPGAAVIRNGEQTGIAQLRGLSGDRVRVLIEGKCITPACPNHMDPPLHYAQPASGDSVEVIAGIVPVSHGGDSIAGVIRIDRPAPVFADSGETLFGGRIGAAFRESQDALSVSGNLFQATDTFRGEYRGSWMDADDLKVRGGRARATQFTTQRHDVVGSVQTNAGYLSVDGGVSRTREAGTPALPMDMVRDDSWHLGLDWHHDFGNAHLETRLYVHDVDHLMDNFSLRPTPPMRMTAPATSRDYGLRSALKFPSTDRSISVGVDLHRAEFDAEQVNPIGLRRNTFNDNRRERMGLFLDWEEMIVEQWTLLAGVRGEWLRTRAGAVASEFGPPPVLADQIAFNGTNRRKTDSWADATVAVRFTPDEQNRLEFGVALKQRAPSLVERYLWTPLNASAGMADGRTYLGDPNLSPERSIEVGFSYSHNADRWTFQFSPFYQSVRNFIEGAPITRLDPNGRPVLQFHNQCRAELYGTELGASYSLSQHWTLQATASMVRGKNRETGDNLYRIPPLTGLVSLTYDDSVWQWIVEGEFADTQNRVARFNDEQTTSGYGLLNLRLARMLGEQLRVEVGVENVFDKQYANHLSGVNRVGGSAVVVGDRIPGTLRSFYINANWQF